MNNQTIVLAIAVVLGVLLFGGYFRYATTSDRYTLSESIDEMTDHHEDDDDNVESYEIYPGDVATKIENNDDIILLDVRTPTEYEEIHLENALLLPVQALSQQSLNDIGLGEDMKDREIYIYCRSGNRSRTAYNIMESLGYTNIKSVAGGMIHWEEDEYPYTESGSYTQPTTADDGNVATDKTRVPQIVFDRTEYDFGVIPQYGGVVMAEFMVSNGGSETLKIGDLTTSCSCTSAKIADTTIAPGEEAMLTVIFDPDFHEEPLDTFKRTVFLPTNDPQNPEAEVSIIVDIAEGQ